MMEIEILTQPDDSTCGPTSLHAVYRYLGYRLPLDTLLMEVQSLEEGGTLGVFLGLDALARGFQVQIHSYNLKMFDPSWADLEPKEIVEKLHRQAEYKKGKKFTSATDAYIRFIEGGGSLRMDELNPGLLRSYFERRLPVLAGVNVTYLYKAKREMSKSRTQSVYDDLRGEPTGHFVVLSGFTDEDKIRVADPYAGNPITGSNYYDVDVHRLINAVHLGIVTYDANLLIISRK